MDKRRFSKEERRFLLELSMKTTNARLIAGQSGVYVLTAVHSSNITDLPLSE